MTISLTATGDNSAMIEYSNDTWQNLMDLIDTFLTTHGWTQTKDTFVYTGMTGARVYEALNKDGVTKKTMAVAYLATGYLGTIVFESFATAGTVGVNVAYGSDTIAAPGNYCQTLIPTSQNGRLHVFATSKWFVMFNIGATVGSTLGHSFNGCFELSKANEGDNTPNHVWLNGYRLSGGEFAANLHGYSCVSPPKTFGYASDPTSASKYTRICTPMGSWGYGNANRVLLGGNYPSYDTTQINIILPNPAPFGTTLKHQVHDMSIAMDCLPTKQAYVKGKLNGLKIFTTSGALSGDVFTAKCDSDYFLDLAGTDKDHFIFRNYDGCCFGLPL